MKAFDPIRKENMVTCILKEVLYKRKALLFALLFLYRFFLDFSYLSFVHPQFEGGRFLLSYGMHEVLGSYLILFFVFSILPLSEDRFSSLGLQLLFVLGYVPITSFYAFGQGDWVWFYVCSSFFVLLIWCTRYMHGFVEASSVKVSRPLTEYKIGFGLLLLPVATLLLIGYHEGLFLNFDIRDIYYIREKFVEVQNKVLFGGYFMNWAGKVALPFLFIIAVFGSRGFRPGLFLISSVLLILLFSTAGHKSYLLLPLLGIGAAVLIQYGDFLRDLLLGMIFLIGGCYLLYEIGGNGVPGSVFIRRLLFMPAQISWFYHDHFQGEFLYLSQSLFKGLIDSPMAMLDSRYIAQAYLGMDANANNGIFSDGLKNFGLIGMYIWALFVAVLLKLGDVVSSGKSKVVLWSFLLLGVYNFINGKLFPTLLTHGFLLIFFITWIYPYPKNENA